MFDHGEQVTWRQWQDGGIDEYGGKLPGSYVEHPLMGVGFAPEQSVDDSSGHRVITTAQIIIRGKTIPYSSRDQFEVRGVRYGVRGNSSGGWINPFTGWSPGQTIDVERVVG